MKTHRTSTRAQHKGGFTLIELLVVIGIIGLLLGLLIPAVMHAREAARRTACQNNLKQLGIALLNHHDAHKSFPPGTDNEWSWSARLLPNLEEANVQGQFDFQREPFEEPNFLGTNTIVPVLLCPSDPRSELIFEPKDLPGYWFAHTSYLGSLDAGSSRRGMFGEYHQVRLAEVTDGTSRTLFVGERGIVEADGLSYGWWVWGPETVLNASNGFREGDGENPQSAKHWWSYHPGGAEFLFVDGSVRFLSYSIDPQLFASLGTKNGGEVVSSF
jgi:prepilin-type N-terminal cleavage/methylation domain-containing protein/prepilin-type processing-associated H-X9-DG protein